MHGGREGLKSGVKVVALANGWRIRGYSSFNTATVSSNIWNLNAKLTIFEIDEKIKHMTYELKL